MWRELTFWSMMLAGVAGLFIWSTDLQFAHRFADHPPLLSEMPSKPGEPLKLVSPELIPRMEAEPQRPIYGAVETEVVAPSA